MLTISDYVITFKEILPFSEFITEQFANCENCCKIIEFFSLFDVSKLNGLETLNKHKFTFSE